MNLVTKNIILAFAKYYIMKIIFIFLVLLTISSCYQQHELPEYFDYEYNQTLDLIKFVEKAADKLQKYGINSFENSEYDNIKIRKDKFVFIYDLNGKCYFHPVLPELESKNIIDFQDINGKKVIKLITEIAANPSKPNGWVHYLWTESGELYPLWKSSYIKGVKAKDGKIYAIGAGIYNMALEKKFVKQLIDSATSLINHIGDSSLAYFRDKSNVFSLYDHYLYAIDFDGNTIIDPAFPKISGRNILNFRDFTGKFIIREMIQKLRTQDSSWMMYMWPKPKETFPSKKIAYIRKVKLLGKPALIGVDIFVAKPIWMKH